MRLVLGLFALCAIAIIGGWCTVRSISPSDDRQWTYSTFDLSGKATEMAQVNSSRLNSTLMLTREKGTGAAGKPMFDVTRGQFLCQGGCEVTARFDEGPELRLPARLPGDGTKHLLVIGDEQRFVEHLKKSTRLLIYANTSPVAGPQFEFNTEPEVVAAHSGHRPGFRVR